MDQSNNAQDFEARWAKIAQALAEPYQGIVGFEGKSATEQLAFLEDRGLSLAELELIFPYLEQSSESAAPELLAAGSQVGSECPIDWIPSALFPVSYGYTETRMHDLSREMIRIYYPSLVRTGSRRDRFFLAGCGRYPLILFMHGHCPNEPTQYQKWATLCGQLAQSGFVVVAPQLPGISGGSLSDSDILFAQQVVTWMRSGVYGSSLLPQTGVVGHSYGAIQGARLANEISAAAFASLSCGLLEWPDSYWEPFFRLDVPKFFTWGTGSGDIYAVLDRHVQNWDAILGMKHWIAFTGAGHWEYLPGRTSKCSGHESACQLVRDLASDFVTTFMARYIPITPMLPFWIRNSLVPFPVDRTPEQGVFARSHLLGLKQLSNSPQCRPLTQNWVTRTGGRGRVTL